MPRRRVQTSTIYISGRFGLAMVYTTHTAADTGTYTTTRLLTLHDGAAWLSY